MLYIESRVYSRIDSEFSDKLKTKFPNLNITTSDYDPDNAKFPTVYVHMLPSIEVGQTLDNTEIEGVNAIFQIDVYDNKTEDNAKRTMREVVRIMKLMRFNITSMPNFQNENGAFKQTARFRRIIGAGDTL